MSKLVYTQLALNDQHDQHVEQKYYQNMKSIEEQKEDLAKAYEKVKEIEEKRKELRNYNIIS